MPADRCEQSERRLVEARGYPTGTCVAPLEGETLVGFSEGSCGCTAPCGQDQCITTIQAQSTSPLVLSCLLPFCNTFLIEMLHCVLHIFLCKSTAEDDRLLTIAPSLYCGALLFLMGLHHCRYSTNSP